MKVTPCGKYDYQTFPIIEGNCFDISAEQLSLLSQHKLEWSSEEYEEKTPIVEKTIEKDGTETETVVGYDTEIRTRPILIPHDPTEENLKKEREARMEELKNLLASTDYKCLKFVDGELTEEEYAEIKAQRHAWREEINLLEESL